MAAATLTPNHGRFESSFSASIARPNLYSADISMADSLPSTKFGFEELRERMANFTARFDDFIERGRKRVLEERNQFRLSVAEIQESQRARRREIESIEHKSSAHQNDLEKEYQEQEEMQNAIGELSLRRKDQLARRDDIKVQIADVQQAIDVHKQSQQQHRRQLDDQARQNKPELHFWESSLCLRIEITGIEDQIRFVYTHMDEKDWNKECSFDLNMGGGQFKVIGLEPSLERDAVQALSDRLYETRDLAGFLKGMRVSFSSSVRA